MRTLALDRPLVFFDTETTGTDPREDRIVEFAAVKLHPDEKRESLRILVDPKVPIPRESSRIHGITDADVEGAPSFGECAAEILAFIAGCDLAGYNIARFDVPLLKAEFARIEGELPLEGVRIVDPQVIFFSREPRDLSAAVRFYCGRELEGAHGAMADTVASLDVLLAQVERYADLPEDVAGLAAASSVAADSRFVDADRRFIWRHGEPYFNFGTKKSRSLREISQSEKDRDRGYLKWILRSDFSQEVKDIVSDALEGKIRTSEGTGCDREKP
ncbi:MAG: exonuclease domain-containing protein [Myxococcota bacterium]